MDGLLELELDWGVSLVSIGVLVGADTLRSEIVLVVVVAPGEAAAACAAVMLSECGRAAQ